MPGGRVRPLRRSVTHLVCGQVTYLDPAVAETFACEPKHYTTTFCSKCTAQQPVAGFVWTLDRKQVGS